MSLVGKIFAVLSLVVAVFYTGITAALVSLQQNYKQKLVESQQDLADAKTIWENKEKGYNSQITALERERTTLVNDRARLEGENKSLLTEWASAKDAVRYAMKIVKDQENQINGLNEHLDRFRADLSTKDKDNEKLRGQIADLNTTLDGVKQKRDELNDKLVVREKELDSLTQESTKLTEDLAYANDLIARIEKEAPDVVEKARRGEAIPPERAIRAKVTAVDSKLGLVVINAGQRQGVKKGYNFIVFRGSKYIGKIVVDEVFPDVAAARYVVPDMKGDVEVGDDVTTKLLEF